MEHVLTSAQYRIQSASTTKKTSESCGTTAASGEHDQLPVSQKPLAESALATPPSSQARHRGTHGAHSYLCTAPHTVRIHNEKDIVRYQRGFLEKSPPCRNHWPRAHWQCRLLHRLPPPKTHVAALRHDRIPASARSRLARPRLLPRH